jgi:hypothetical protein
MGGVVAAVGPSGHIARAVAGQVDGDGGCREVESDGSGAQDEQGKQDTSSHGSELLQVKKDDE